MLSRKVGSWLLRQCIRSSNPTLRFYVDTFFSPSVYLLLDRVTLPAPGTKEEDRCKALEDVLFPVLHPKSENPIDLHVVESNIRFRSWVRNAYLQRRYGDSFRLREAENIFMTNMERAPSVSRMNQVFGTSDWERNPKTKEDALQRELIKCYEENDDSVGLWNLEQLLECIGCCIHGMNEFNLFCERNFVYEFFTQDYIDSLAFYLTKRASQVCEQKGKNSVTILEVGAGNGQLTSLLSHALKSNQKSSRGTQKKSIKIEIIATDTGVWKARHNARNTSSSRPANAVKRMSYVSSLAEYQPDIVLCSWMPMNQDWSSAFRSCPSTVEYILIGEIDDGCCGHSAKTWGVIPKPTEGVMFSKNKESSALLLSKDKSIDLFHWLSKIDDHVEEPRLPQSAQDAAESSKPWAPNFVREELPLSHLQLSRYDRKHYASNSHTISFRRAENII